jgi:glycosyltransferase involved in cell wall biosynthesis
VPANETVRRESEEAVPGVSVIVPARNEEVSLGECVESLVSQRGVDFEIIVVDDHSTDRTREIAASFLAAYESKLRVVGAGPLPPSCTGKNNAISAGVNRARGHWLLFTDADTVHLPGSLARALAEAQVYRVDMLSYSPQQIAVTFWEMAVLPVVFAELARQYPPLKVSNPNSPAAAANGQYILVSREAYHAVGGHAAVAREILEDVALARRFKAAGKKVRFRYAADAVRTRMYRNWTQLRDGWTKNLALLFPRPGWLAAETLIVWGGAWLLLSWTLVGGRHWLWSPVLILAFFFVLGRLVRSDFSVGKKFLAFVFGLPMFAYLLLRSKRAHARGKVPWKGRTYSEKLAAGH